MPAPRRGPRCRPCWRCRATPCWSCGTATTASWRPVPRGAHLPAHARAAVCQALRRSGHRPRRGGRHLCPASGARAAALSPSRRWQPLPGGHPHPLAGRRWRRGRLLPGPRPDPPRAGGAAAAAAEATYSAIFQSAPYAALLLDRRGGVADANDAALALYGQHARGLDRHAHGEPAEESPGRAPVLQPAALARLGRMAPPRRRERVSCGRGGLPGARGRPLPCHRDAARRHAGARHDRPTAGQRGPLALRTRGPRRRALGLGHRARHLLRVPRAQRAARPHRRAPAPHPGLLERAGASGRPWPADAGAGGAPEGAERPSSMSRSACASRARATAGSGMRGCVLERDADGRATRMLGSVRDVHDQKMQAEELARWREQVQHTSA